MPLDYTVDTKGATEVRIKTTGHEKKRFTVNLCVLKDGTKLPPFVILDRKTLLKICIPESKLIVAANGSGWMNHETLEIWLKKYERIEIHCRQRHHGTRIQKYHRCFYLICIVHISSLIHLIKLRKSPK